MTLISLFWCQSIIFLKGFMPPKGAYSNRTVRHSVSPRTLYKLHLLNHRRDFIETLQEWLLPSLVVQIVRNFCSNYFWLSYPYHLWQIWHMIYIVTIIFQELFALELKFLFSLMYIIYYQSIFGGMCRPMETFLVCF